MIASAFIIGFFSAIGWWGGNKVTTAVDVVVINQPAVTQCEVKK